MSKKKPGKFPKTLYVTDEQDGDDTYFVISQSLPEAAKTLQLNDEETGETAEYELKRVLTIKRAIEVTEKGN